MTMLPRTSKSVLVVEDESDLSELLCYNLRKEGYSCRCVGDGSAALDEARRQRPDLVVLDRMLPKKSGDDVAAALRRDPQNATLPILMLTAKAEESDQLVGFALGANDYVTKPFSMKVLLARISALLRRVDASAVDERELQIGPIRLDPARFEVQVENIPVSLTTTEFRILKTLMSADARVLDRTKLIDMVLGPMVAVTDRAIDVHIVALRKKLGPASTWIQTVRGVGYTFRSPGENDGEGN